MRFPSIRNVAHELQTINRDVDGECDVRLCVDEDGSWIVRWGLVDYDPAHSAYCGASSVPGDGKRFNSYSTARELIEQCKEQVS